MNSVPAMKIIGIKLNMYPNDNPYIILVADPVLQELEIVFKKKGCVASISATVETKTQITSPNSRHKYAW